MNIKNFLFISLLSVSLITSCAEKKEETVLSSVSPITGVEGTWHAACDQGLITTTVFSGISYTITQNLYLDSGCASTAALAVQTGTYSLGTLTNYGVLQEGEIDYTYSTFNVTPTSVGGANLLNSMTLCGFSNWSNGVTKSILGATCSGEAVPLANQIEYSIYDYILTADLFTQYGLKPGDMMFGTNTQNGDDGTSPSNRHQGTLQNIFRKQ